MPSQKQLLEIINIQTEIAKLGLDLGEVMTLVVERTVSLIGADGAAIELAEGNDMVYRAVAGNARPHLGLRLSQQNSLSGECVRTGKMLRCEDSESDPRVDRDACRQVGLRSMIVMPLKYGESTVGVLKAMSAQQSKFKKGDEALLGLLSDVIGAAMYFAAKFDSDSLFHKATHDGLTDLANRSLFMDRLRNVLERRDRDHRQAAVLMIDMDGLKAVNDAYGHRTGDAVLKEFANRLKAASRRSDTVARLGGDEFAIILTPAEVPDGINAATQRITSRLASPFLFEDFTLPMRASIGAASIPADGTDIEQLLEKADHRMYAVKKRHHVEYALAKPI